MSQSKIRTHSKIDDLPSEIIAEVNRLVLEDDATYSDIAAHLRELGHEVSRSSVGRYGRRVLQKRQEVQATVAVAKELALLSEGAELEALASTLALDKVVSILMTMDIGLPEDEDFLSIASLTAIMRAVATMQNASLAKQKYDETLRDKARQAAEDVAKTAARGGLSRQTIDEIKSRILGITQEPPA